MEYIKLKEVCDLKNGFAFKSSDYIESSNVLNCRMSNIRPNATFDAEYNPKYLPEELPMGKILGKVTITDCVPMSDEFADMLSKENSDIYTTHSFSRNFGFQMENVVPFKKQIDAKGQLGFWNIDIDEKDLM